jgi:putative Holliday junction resolvase
MPLRNPTDLARLISPGIRLLGLDLGTKTIGVALSDTSLAVATPLETIRRGKFSEDAARLQQLREALKIGALVIGLPLNMDGSAGPRVQSTRAFAQNLLKLDDPEICFWDERLSTAAVTRGMIEADLSRRRRAQLVDRAAAAYILQGLLDRLSYLRAEALSGEAAEIR